MLRFMILINVLIGNMPFECQLTHSTCYFENVVVGCSLDLIVQTQKMLIYIIIQIIKLKC